MTQPMSTTANRHSPWIKPLLAGAVVAALAAAAWTIWQYRSQPDNTLPDDDDPLDQPPIVTEQPFTSPYRNTRPGIEYVGDRACAKCHADEAAAYRHHPMSRSCATADKLVQDPARVSFEFQRGRFEVERRGQTMIHRESYRSGSRVLAEMEAEVAVVIGSGHQGKTFLVNRDGYLYESPISWYSHKETAESIADWFSPRRAWDLSPGYHEQMVHFNRPITFQCLFCHCDQVTPVKETINRFQQPLFGKQASIGCERCHGPGQLHVDSRLRGEVFAPGSDLNIVHPAKLSPELREAICQQCHLQGQARVERRDRSVFDYRPGLPLERFLAVYIRPPKLLDSREAVGQVEQMHLSRCFLESSPKKKLGCTSCHDPHTVPEPAARAAFYRGRCLKCHEETSCRLEPARRRQQHADDSCIACHMPRGDSTVIHAAVTDHRIPRKPVKARRPVAEAGRSGVPLVPFFVDAQPSSPDEHRDLGLAMIKMARGPQPEELLKIIGATAAPHLQLAVQHDPGDVAAWEALGFAWAIQQRPREALEALRTALAKSPHREQALRDAVGAAMQLGDLQTALVYNQRLRTLNPWSPFDGIRQASLLAAQRRWDQMAQECRAVLRLAPDSVSARQMLIDACLRTGQAKQARAELDVLTALNPTQAKRLRAWFAELGKTLDKK